MILFNCNLFVDFHSFYVNYLLCEFNNVLLCMLYYIYIWYYVVQPYCYYLFCSYSNWQGIIYLDKGYLIAIAPKTLWLSLSKAMVKMKRKQLAYADISNKDDPLWGRKKTCHRVLGSMHNSKNKLMLTAYQIPTLSNFNLL